MILGEYAVDFELPEDCTTVRVNGIFNSPDICTGRTKSDGKQNQTNPCSPKDGCNDSSKEENDCSDQVNTCAHFNTPIEP